MAATRTITSGPGQGFEELGERGHFLLRGVDDRAPFLQRRRGPVFVLETHAAILVDLDHDRVHRLDVQLHAPAAAEACITCSVPTTIDAIWLLSATPAYAYSMFTFASASSLSAGASEPGVLGTVTTTTSFSLT